MEFQDSLFPEDRERIRLSLIFGTPQFEQAYRRYINSPPWKKLCAKVKKRAKGQCERCGTFPHRFETHHLNYERFQNELLSDLQGLCPSCHAKADREREQDKETRFEQKCEDTRYSNAQNTYFTKKYGEDWGDRHYLDSERMDAEFDSWIERKNGDESD